jgi:rRNA maturation endonuclease Nob1
MPEFRDAIPAAGGKVEYLYDSQRGIAAQISGSGLHAIYQVALSIDGKTILAAVPIGGLGATSIAPQPSILAFVQSDEQRMWGRNCPICEKYFRTDHIMGSTTCPYCGISDPDLAFISKDQKRYLTACYDACARAYLNKSSTSVDMADITDVNMAWHYSEIKQQFHFVCQRDGCKCQTDILGEYGYCPRCSRSNAHNVFFQKANTELARVDEISNTVLDKHELGREYERMSVDAVSRFEALAKHLRRRLLLHPMTVTRRRGVEDLNFQQLMVADSQLKQWFDIGLFEWPGNKAKPKRKVTESEKEFIGMMLQKRHILIHNGGVVDKDYLAKSGDKSVQLDERIMIPSFEAKRFLYLMRDIAMNLMDNIEEGFS